MKTYRDLIVWQKAMLLVTDMYHLTNTPSRRMKFMDLLNKYDGAPFQSPAILQKAMGEIQPMIICVS